MFDMVERIEDQQPRACCTGDIHSSWAYDLPRRPFDGYDKTSGKGSLGVEFAGTSISSPSNLGAGPDGTKQLAGIRRGAAASALRGWPLSRLFHPRPHASSACRRTSTRVATVQERSTKERFEKGFITESGRNHLIEVIQSGVKPAVPGI